MDGCIFKTFLTDWIWRKNWARSQWHPHRKNWHRQWWKRRSAQATYWQGLRFAQRIIKNVEKQFNLNEAQSRAYRMFLEHLESVQRGVTHIDETESWCLYLGGAAGTGKSKVLHAIKSLFEKLGKQDEPLVSATTGMAAKLIRGSTIDSRCHFRKRAGSNSDRRISHMAV
jgi:hypothetical protein